VARFTTLRPDNDHYAAVPISEGHRAHLAVLESFIESVDDSPGENVGGFFEIDTALAQGRGPFRGIVGDLHEFT
jgi:hypothetical protein